LSRYLSQLVHVEMSTPNLEESVRFYETHLGLKVVSREGGKAFLRCWGDYYGYSYVLSEGPEVALVRMAWRTKSAELLEEAAASIEANGVTGVWKEPAEGHGRSYEFVGPYGHAMELYWEVDAFVAGEENRSIYPDRPEKRPNHGIGARHLDHVTVAASDVQGFAEWYSAALDFRIMAYAAREEQGVTTFGVITTNEKSHDLGVVLDSSARAGRINHLAFWLETDSELFRAADLLLEHGTHIEYGPGIHGVGEQNYLYFREPSSFRIELNAGGYRNYVPDWKPRVWQMSQANDFYRNLAPSPTLRHSFPYADGKPSATEDGLIAGTEADLLATARS
jgi:catechol 2,3-dioxygenase